MGMKRKGQEPTKRGKLFPTEPKRSRRKGRHKKCSPNFHSQDQNWEGEENEKKYCTYLPNLGFFMEDCNRSRSYGDGKMELHVSRSRDAPPPFSGFHHYSGSSSYPTSDQTHQPRFSKEGKPKKGKGSHGSSSSRSGWSLSDPEVQRKKRVASYKVYSVEGKMKGSFRKSFRWLKDMCRLW